MIYLSIRPQIKVATFHYLFTKIGDIDVYIVFNDSKIIDYNVYGVKKNEIGKYV